jgi:hypothetical protein
MKYLAVSNTYYAKGKTVEDSMFKLKKSGGSIQDSKYGVYQCEDSCCVDSYGRIFNNGTPLIHVEGKDFRS